MSKEYEMVIKIKGEVVYKRESIRPIAQPEDLEIEFTTHIYDDKYPYLLLNDEKVTKTL